MSDRLLEAEPSEDLGAERDLYRELLELGTHDDLEPFVSRALALVVRMARARRGYLELRSEGIGASGDWWIGHAQPPEDAELFREAISQGVIAEALATCRTVATASAVTDPRFQERSSVRRNRIEAVLCTPIGRERSLGVIYLQDREQPGPFTEADVYRIELFARHIEPFADRLLIRRRERDASDPTLAIRARIRADGVVGRSKAMARVLEQVAMVAPHRISVLFTGPTGSGKTQLAHVIHDNGPRSARPFVELNCATMPDNLIENELFGAVAGAHSAATVSREGKVAAARGGTLFLDEVGELSASAQSKLLQFLQSGKFYPLGSTVAQDADVRVIAATNADLEEAVAKRTFREDLYYRLNVMTIHVPGLADRVEDIPLLATHFCAQVCAAHGLRDLSLSGAALVAAETADWPGNVRQLANAIEAAILRANAEESSQVEAHHLFPERWTDDAPNLTFEQQVRRFKRVVLSRALEETNWNVSEAARRLDLARSHMNKLIRSLALRRGEGPPHSS